MLKKKFNPGHYLQDKSNKSAPPKEALAAGFTGLLMDLPWAKVEPEPEQYDFRLLDQWLAWCGEHNRQLVIMIMDRDFRNGPGKIVPSWVPNVPFNEKRRNSGCVAKIWTPEVTAMRVRLITAIAERYDNHARLEAITLPETALGGIDRKSQPDYNHVRYCNEIVKLIHAVAPALKRTQLWQSINWLGNMDSPHLATIADAIVETGAGGLTNPDSVPWEWDDKPMYQLMADYSDRLAIALGGDTSQLEEPGKRYKNFAELARLQYDMAQKVHAHYQLWNRGFFSHSAGQQRANTLAYQDAVESLIADAPLSNSVPMVMVEKSEEKPVEVKPPVEAKSIDVETLRSLLAEMRELAPQLTDLINRAQAVVE